LPDIRIHREHCLGLPRARELARQWADEAERRFDMACTLVPGADADTVEFVRSGVRGRLIAAPDHFDLHAQLGFLLGAFSKTIEQEIQKNLDALLAGAAPVERAPAPPVQSDAAAPPQPARRAAAGPRARRSGKPG
jgi:putative polyhydroxyalkanoate system protein